MSENKRNAGRPPHSEAEREAIMKCINRGLSYNVAKAELIEQGFVDESGECTVSVHKYDYCHKAFSKTKVLKVQLPREVVDWGNNNLEEIAETIKAMYEAKATL